MDGLMDVASAERWRSHLSTCPDCARYDRVLRRGVNLLNQQPGAEPADDFFLQLNQRLLHEEHHAYTRPVTSLAAASIAVAAMLAFAAWIPVLMLSQESAPHAIV